MRVGCIATQNPMSITLPQVAESRNRIQRRGRAMIAAFRNQQLVDLAGRKTREVQKLEIEGFEFHHFESKQITIPGGFLMAAVVHKSIRSNLCGREILGAVNRDEIHPSLRAAR